jgi:sugar diacid utilization regulator
LRTALTLRPPATAGGRLHGVTGGAAIVLLGSVEPIAEPDLRGYADRLLHRIRDLSAGRFDCVAGIGAGLPGLERAGESAAQARLARRSAATGLGPEIAAWTQLGPYGILLRIPPADLDATALPAELQRLLRADPQGQLTRTVRAYLDHAGNGPAAAEALHIHRTTLYYRLGRIRELTGLDLDDGRTRLTLHLGLTLADVIAATAPVPRAAGGAPWPAQ